MDTNEKTIRCTIGWLKQAINARTGKQFWSESAILRAEEALGLVLRGNPEMAEDWLACRELAEAAAEGDYPRGGGRPAGGAI